jgi:hypothetical protein
MDTLKIIIVEYLLGHCLQSFAIFFGIYTFNRMKINIKNYLLVSSLMAVVSCLVRLLPISIGVHTIINMLFTYLICVILLKMPAYITIRSNSLCVVIILISEIVVSSAIMLIKGNAYFETLMNNSLNRAIIGLIANVVFAVIILLVYIILKKKGDNHRKISP